MICVESLREMSNSLQVGFTSVEGKDQRMSVSAAAVWLKHSKGFSY